MNIRLRRVVVGTLAALLCGVVAPATDAPNPIGYGSGATCGPAGIACFTRSVPDRFTMWFRQQGYPFDWGTLRWCQAYSSPPTGCFDVENIALDEFAHIEGLGHHVNYADERDYLDAVVQTYSRQKPVPPLERKQAACPARASPIRSRAQISS